MIGGRRLQDPWKQPANIAALKKLSNEWRHTKNIGSVLTLADFLATGKNKNQLPRTRKSIAELQFLYSMSGESPLKQFLSNDEKWTRISVRLPDLPADQNRRLIATMQSQIKAQFPQMEVRASGLAATVPVVNADLSGELMWGFFESLFWIVLILALAFRSLRWALVAVVPNLVPPVLLLGFLALFQIPIKPGIAIIFSISLGLAFCNTVYVLERLKHILKSKAKRRSLPIYTLMKKETMPCLVSSLSLFAGFAIFLFSVFPVNKMFGVFMLISIGAGLLGDLVWLPVLLRRFPWLLLENGEGMLTNRFSLKWQTAAKAAPYVLLVVLGLMAFRSSYAAEDIQSILKQVEAHSAPPNERVNLRMTIEEADGSKKVRELSILRKNEGGARALIRLQKPSDLKGLALLTMSKGGNEEQYLYLPSDKKSRRILGSNKKGKFLDSEIAYEDLALSTYKEFANRVMKDDGHIIQIESKAKPGSESSYGRILTWISKPDYRVERVDYFDKNNKLLKRAVFKKYEKLESKFWRARDVHVQNVQTNRKTELSVLQVSLKKIDDDEVSLSALEE
jgi:preprotein translocase subunit SecF